MENKQLELMNETIRIANKNNDIFVGVIVANNGSIICSNKNQNFNDNWANFILEKLNKLNINSVEELYLTINTYQDENFDLNKVLQNIKVKKIYIGLPDPKLNKYLKSDPFLNLQNINRYPEQLQKTIIAKNYKSFYSSSQNIKNNLYYSEKRISEFLREQLLNHNLNISRDEISHNKTKEKMMDLLISKYNCSASEANFIINSSLSTAFNKKYALYDYKNDIRSLNNNWSENFFQICKDLSCDLENENIINVGVGSGTEAINLFKGCKKITFVDIASDGLKNIKKIYPNSKIVVSSADNLKIINDNEYDIYISLRTFNSSFFNIEKSLTEAKRVLKEKSKIIISIANGFLSVNSEIIPGLIIPGTDFVDIYKGIDCVNNIIDLMSKLGFDTFKLLATNEELYLTANLTKKGR